MKKIICMLFLFSFLATSVNATDSNKKEDMLKDLEIIQNAFQVKYAPAEWKKELFQWDLTAEIESAKMEVLQKNNITTKGYRKIVKNFFNSTRDYHVNVSFVSTEMAFLPLRIEGANGRYFIAALDDECLPKKAKELQVGDEILSIDGKPVKKVLDQLREKELSANDSETDYALIEYMLTMRLGSEGHHIPKGSVAFKVQSATTAKVKTYKLPWDYYGELIKGPFPTAKARGSWPDLPKENVLKHPFFHRKMSLPLHDRIQIAKKYYNFRKQRYNTDDEEWVHDMTGYKKSRLPRLNTPIWESKSSSLFDAYIYKNKDGKRVAFVRIPTFYPFDCVEAAKQFAELIDLFEKYTDCLVIDQQSNPGGDLFYMYTLLSMLTDKPLDVPSQQETITQLDALFVLQVWDYFSWIEQNLDKVDLQKILGEDFSGYPVDENLVHSVCDYCKFILAEWNLNHNFSEPCFIFGIDQIQPNPAASYSKPILLLVNNLDFSCGDFFPAILQDNNRATLMGTRTSGAGGYVIGATHHNRFGIAHYTLTGSIAERPSHQKIENLGVTPEIPYKLSVKDLQNHYEEYTREINKVVNTLID